jgi:hypothetical protein
MSRTRRRRRLRCERDHGEHACRKLYDQMARIAITPHWVRFYDFGAGRLPRFLQDLAERSRS